MKLISKENAKTRKGEKKGVLTGILYLAPHNLSGYQVCPKATEGCIKACLFTAGHGAYGTVQAARIRKTRMFFEDRETFMNLVVEDIEYLIRKQKRDNMKQVAVRMNGTSDLPWEKIAVFRNGVKHKSVMHAFPEVMFYDYTKVANRRAARSIKNYHLTFSLAENNVKDAAKALKDGVNVAVVVKMKRNLVKPAVWNGVEVVDGDVDDIRYQDGEGGKLIMLFAKGKGRKDNSGFVKNMDEVIPLIARG